MLRRLFFYTSLIVSFVTSAQVAVGQWNDHVPFNKGFKVADAGNKVFIACDPALF